MGGGPSSNFGSLGFLVLILGIWVSGTDLGDLRGSGGHVGVTCEIKGRETHVAWVMRATVNFY